VRKWLIVAAVLVQVGVLGWMAAEREWVLRSGKPMFLRTAPIDPQDPMRGDYVRLTYEIATVPKSLCRDGVTEWFSRHEDIYNSRVRDRRVYASVRLKAEDLVEIVALSDRPPTEGLYLRGRAQAIHLSTLEIRFGVEALFMQQGKARQFEQTVQTEKAGVPLNVEVAVGTIRAGTVVGQVLSFTGYRDGAPFLTCEEYWVATLGIPQWNLSVDDAPFIRVLVEGMPRLRVDLTVDDVGVPGLPGTHGGHLLVGMTALRALPHVRKAPPGIVTAPVFGAAKRPRRSN